VFCEFEKTLESKIVLKDMSVDDFYEFANYLESAGYNPKTIERQIGRMKFFCLRCDEESIKISTAFRQRIYIDKDDDEIESVYLSEEEIDKIYNLQIYDDNLDNARDLLVISCFSGLRVSDLMHSLDTSKVKDGIISIRTKKTGAFVKVPVHNYCSEILNKRLGNLPRKFSDYEYNCLLKILGEKAGINKVVYGKLWDASKKRKVLGYREKWRYFSSHIARRSFATNLAGKVPTEVIQSVAGWSSATMAKFYDKTSKTEHANKLKSYWNGE
jgi:integrase